MYLAILLLVLAKYSHFSPFANAGIYAVAKFTLLLALGGGFLSALLAATIGFVLAFGYFVILLRLDRSIIGWFMFGVFGALAVTLL